MSSESRFAHRADSDESQQGRGIEPDLLRTQVINTAPFAVTQSDPDPRYNYISILRSPYVENDLGDYFQFLIAAHFATVGTFVPTDVDQTIRLKLWKFSRDESRLAMAHRVMEFLDWDESLVSKKRLFTPSGRLLTGHYGEWLSIALPAYWFTKDLDSEISTIIYDRILALIEFHEQAFAELLRARDYRSLLDASVLVAHNLGDFDRVLDIHHVPLTHEFWKRDQYPAIFKAGELNRKMTATENHRHFPLRKPRALRQSYDLLLPIGPFYDDWGRTLARHPSVDENALAEIVEALIEGWEKLNQKIETVGYARALSGILGSVRGGSDRFLKLLPAAKRRLVAAGPLRTMMSISQERFEESWTRRAEKALSGI